MQYNAAAITTTLPCSLFAEYQKISQMILRRTPTFGQNGFRITKRFEEWSTYLDRLATLTQELFITR